MQTLFLAQSVDQTADYFAEISRSFATLSDRNQLPTQAILILLVVVLLLVAAIIVMRIRAKRTPGYVPYGWAFTPEQIRDTLNLALDQRSKFEMQFHTQAGNRRITYCSPSEIRSDAIWLQVDTSGSTTGQGWKGRKVDCYFRVWNDKRVQTHYMFTSDIIDARSQGETLLLVGVALPERLEQRQKRASLRVTPPEQYILGIALWPEKIRPDGTQDLSLRNWGSPSLSLIPGKRAELRLVNVSAGGIKLFIPRQHVRTCGLAFAKGDKLFLLLDLWEPETGQRLRFWLLCRVQNPVVNHDTQDMELGLQFLRRADTREDSLNELAWLPNLRDHEVEDVGNWAIKRHLELYREKEGQ